MAFKAEILALALILALTQCPASSTGTEQRHGPHSGGNSWKAKDRIETSVLHAPQVSEGGESSLWGDSDEGSGRSSSGTAEDGSRVQVVAAESIKNRKIQVCDDATLSSTLSNAIDGQTVFVCSGVVNVGSEMMVSANSVTLSCVGTARSCVLQQSGGRILTVQGNSFTLDGMTLKGGRADTNGGGLQLLGGGTHRVLNSAFQDNQALGGSGGGVYSTSGSSITIQNTQFNGNSAARQGGAGSITNFVNSFAMTGSGNSAPQCPDFYLQVTGFCQPMEAASSPIPAPTPVFPTPFPGPSPRPPQPDRTCQYSTFSALDQALRTASNGQRFLLCPVQINCPYELQVYASSVTISCFGTAGSCILNKPATDSGRLLGVQGDGVTIEGISFRNGKAANGNGGGVAIFGGQSHTVRMCDFQGNSANGQGGGLWATSNQAGNTSNRLFLSGCRFVQNTSGQNGGGLAVQNVYSVSLQNCDFESNSSNSGGGGFYLTHNSIVRINFGLVTANYAGGGSGGGGIITYSSDAVVDGTNFVSNTAGNGAGGLRVYMSNISVRNANFRNNVSQRHSGGLSIEGDNSSSRRGDVSQVKFDNNEARTSFGGGLAILNMPNSQVTSATFTYNRSPNGQGGAAYVTSRPTETSSNEGANNLASSCHDVWVTSTQECVALPSLGAGSAAQFGAPEPVLATAPTGYVVVSNAQSANIQISNASGATDELSLNDLSKAERDGLQPLLESHLENAAQNLTYTNGTIVTSVVVTYIDVGLGEDAETVFTGQLHFDGIPFVGEEVLNVSGLDVLIAGAFRGDQGEDFLVQVRSQSPGRLQGISSFEVQSYVTADGTPDVSDDDAVTSPSDNSEVSDEDPTSSVRCGMLKVSRVIGLALTGLLAAVLV